MGGRNFQISISVFRVRVPSGGEALPLADVNTSAGNTSPFCAAFDIAVVEDNRWAMQTRGLYIAQICE